MATVPTPYITPEQYLELDSRSDRRSEYHDGEMFVVEGTTLRHNRIQMNLTGLMLVKLKHKPCQPLGSTVRVRIPRSSYFYPDFVVACAKPELGAHDTLLNPSIVFEILSDSTADFDLGYKGEQYRSIPTLKEYIVIEQRQAKVQRWTRQPSAGRAVDRWLVETFAGLDSVLPLEAADCDVPLADLYDEVEFDPEAGAVERVI
jgi:Uma2 family endonuclease